VSEFQRDYSDWEQQHNLKGMMREIHDQNADRWLAAQEARS
jgi:hypothetical protein